MTSWLATIIVNGEEAYAYIPPCQVTLSINNLGVKVYRCSGAEKMSQFDGSKYCNIYCFHSIFVNQIYSNKKLKLDQIRFKVLFESTNFNINF